MHDGQQGDPAAVRDSTAADVAAIAAIYAHHVDHGSGSFETVPPSVGEMAERRTDIIGRGLPHLVIERSGSVAGFAYAGPFRARAAYRHTVEDSIYLHPEAIGAGLGHRLLAELIARCEAIGLRQMLGLVGDSGNAASIRLHERLGFMRVGTMQSVGFKHGRWCDVVVLQRALGTGDRGGPDSGERIGT